jgi:hypothetical protein
VKRVFSGQAEYDASVTSRRPRPDDPPLHLAPRQRRRGPLAERSAARLAHQSGGLGVPGSNPGAPTNKIKDLHQKFGAKCTPNSAWVHPGYISMRRPLPRLGHPMVRLRAVIGRQRRVEVSTLHGADRTRYVAIAGVHDAC